MLLYVALQPHTKKEDIPQHVIIISDMEFDHAVGNYYWQDDGHVNTGNVDTLLESIAKKWKSYGLDLPELIFWNVDARSNNIAMRNDGTVNYVSGMSPVIFEQVMKGLTAWDLMMDKLNSSRYKEIN